MQDQIPNVKLPSPTELFTEEAFESGKEITEFGNIATKVQGVQDGSQQNKISDEDELDKYLGKKSSGISSYTRKNSVDSGSGHGGGGISECHKITKPQPHFINNDETSAAAASPSWKLTFCVKKFQKTNYSQVAANIRDENKINQNQILASNNSDLPPLDPRKGLSGSGSNKDTSCENNSASTGCSTWITTDDEDMELNLHLSDDEMDDEFQPIVEDISSTGILQPDRLSDEQTDFSEKGFTSRL